MQGRVQRGQYCPHNEVNEPGNTFTYTPTQVSQVDHENVQATALKTVFDLIRVYGLEAFSSHAPPAAGDSRTSSDQASAIGDSQVHLVLSAWDHLTFL